MEDTEQEKNVFIPGREGAVVFNKYLGLNAHLINTRPFTGDFSSMKIQSTRICFLFCRLDFYWQ